MYKKTENTKAQDAYGNLITIPAGFKVVIDSTTNNASHVTEGIVIQDEEGNQFVWVPVGKVYTTADETTKESTAKTITLSRYEFADGESNYTANDGSSLGILAKGTPINREKAEILHEKYPTDYFKEDTIEGDNIHAKELEIFKNSTNETKGYYIARYEASYGTDGKPNSKISEGTPPNNATTKPSAEKQLWNNITQSDAVIASRNMYKSEKFTSDLVNSYAWDTAIIFIQTLGGDDYKKYSRQDGVSINPYLSNTGVNGDNPLNINDMASNLHEWTTETFSNLSYPCTIRGGTFYNFTSTYTAYRNNYDTSHSNFIITFRPILYVKN